MIEVKSKPLDFETIKPYLNYWFRPKNYFNNLSIMKIISFSNCKIKFYDVTDLTYEYNDLLKFEMSPDCINWQQCGIKIEKKMRPMTLLEKIKFCQDKDIYVIGYDNILSEWNNFSIKWLENLTKYKIPYGEEGRFEVEVEE
jgi:hypothetical protein